MPAGSLEVMVLEAKGIKDTEVFGKSDPYAVLTCGQIKLRTPTAEDQGSHPVWNQKLVFNIDEGIYELIVRIYNENVVQDDEIGCARIPLAKVFSDGRVPPTPYNVIRPSGRTQGVVKLELTFTPKGSRGKGTDGLGSSTSSHGAAYPSGPYGGIHSYGTQPPKYGNVPQSMGAYPTEKSSGYPPNPYPSSPYPPPSSNPQNPEHFPSSAYPGYPPPANMPSAYPSSPYPPPSPYPYSQQHSYSAGYPPPVTHYGGTTDPYKGNMPHESYHGAPYSSPSAPELPVKKMEELSLSTKPSKDKHDMAYSSPSYASTEYGMAGEKDSKAKPGECYPPYGSSGTGENPAAGYSAVGTSVESGKPGKEKKQGSFDCAQTAYPHEPYPGASSYGYPPAGTSVESGKPVKEKKQSSFDGHQTAYPQPSYSGGSIHNPPYGYQGVGENPDAGYPLAGHPVVATSIEAGKPGKEKKQDSFEYPQTAYPPSAYPGASPYGYPPAGMSAESGKPAKEKKQSSFDGSQTAYPQEPYSGGSSHNLPYGYPGVGEDRNAGYPQAGYPVAGISAESGKPGKEKKQGNSDGPQIAYPQELYPGGSFHYAPGGYPVSGDKYGDKYDDGKHGKNKEEKQQNSFNSHHGAYTAYAQEPYLGGSNHNHPYGYQGAGDSPAAGYPPTGYPLAGTSLESGKPGKEKKQGSFDGRQTGHPQEPYPGGSFHYAPSGYPVSADQHVGKHDESKHGKNKEEKKHDTFDGHYGAYTAYTQAPYQGGSFHYDRDGGKHDEGKHGKNKEEKKHGSFDGHHGPQISYPLAPYVGGSSHYTPGGYPVSGDHYGEKHGEGKHGKYKEEKHGKHGKHGKHSKQGKFKGFKLNW